MTPALGSDPVDLGEGFSVEFRWADGEMTIIWSPDLPPKHIGRKLIPAYQAARHRFIGNLADTLGINVAVVDL